MICSLSGEVAEEPVLSTKSGHVFERRLLAKHLDRNQQDPITQVPMTMEDDTIAVQTASEIVRPRPSANSLPAMLSTFRDEWDALMLEQFTLRQSLHSTRQELSQALYRFDAATRVIARLKAERDDARSQMSQAEAPAIQTSSMKIEGGEPAATLPDHIVDKINVNSQKLSSGRRQAYKNPSETLAKADDIAEYVLEDEKSFTIHLSSKPGINCVDAHQVEKCLVATGGPDARVVIFDIEAGRIRDTLKGHSKQVLSVAFHQERLLVASASDDATVRLWESSEDGIKAAATFSDHSDSVASVSMHSSGDYFGSVSADKTIGFYDLEHMSLVHQFASDQVMDGYSCGNFHPDGVLYAGGAGDQIWIWDLLRQSPVKAFQGHTGAITSLSFSANGFYMAAADASGGSKIWDLRKLQAVYDLPQQSVVNSVRFDSTGHYLALAGESIQVFSVGKPWQQLVQFDQSEQAVSDVVFGADAAFIASVSMDRHLNIYAAPTAADE